MTIIPKIVGAVSTLAVCASAGVGIGMATNENFKNDVYNAVGVVSEQKYNETETYLKEVLGQTEILKADKISLQNSLNEKTNHLTASQARVAELEINIAEKESALAESNATIETLQAQLTTKQTELESKQSRVAELESEIADIQNALSESNSNNEELQTQLATKQSELETEKTRVTELENQVETLNENINLQILGNGELRSEINNLNAELTSKQILINGLQEQISALNHELEAKQSQIDALEGSGSAEEFFENATAKNCIITDLIVDNEHVSYDMNTITISGSDLKTFLLQLDNVVTKINSGNFVDATYQKGSCCKIDNDNYDKSYYVYYDIPEQKHFDSNSNVEIHYFASSSEIDLLNWLNSDFDESATYRLCSEDSASENSEGSTRLSAQIWISMVV